MKKSIWTIVLVIAIVIIVFILLGNNSSRDSEETTVSVQEEAGSVSVETEETSLTSIDPYTGSGVATRSFGEEEFTHSVTAEIADPAEGKFFEGWLVDKTPELRFFSTGRLEKQGDQYVLVYSASADERDFTQYPDVVITEETEANGLDGVPEDHVLEGAF